MMAQTPGPLHGIRVVDFSSFIAGCYATAILGDMGADVVKVEPLTGDPARHWGPFLNGEGRLFQGWNRNKRSLSVDLRSEEGLGIVHKLLAKADVIVENFRPGTVERLKVDYETVRESNPSVIYLSISAFGARGPYGTRPGYDPILQSMSGTARGNVRYCGNVGICSVAISDYGAAMLGANAITAALFHRERTGEGQKIDTSLLQSVMAIQSHLFVKPLETEETPPYGIYPYRLFETQDDLIFIAAGTDKFWRILCDCLGVPEIGNNPKYATNAKRVTHADELTGLLQPYFHERTTAEWESLLVDKGVPCGPVQTYDEFFDDPQVEAMNMNAVVEHTTVGPMRMAGIPVEMGATPGSIRIAPPVLGEHSAAVLGELDYDPAAVADLHERGVVWCFRHTEREEETP